MKLVFTFFATIGLILQVVVGENSPSKHLDNVIKSKLNSLGKVEKRTVGDQAFCRRVYLDVAGRIPTLKEMQTFLGDQRKDKRAILIDALLDSKGYVSNFHNFWADLLRITYVGDKLHSMVNYSEWVKSSLRENKPIDQMVKELVTAEGDLYKPGNGATGFYAREVMHLDHTASTVKAFLGMSIECAQCHDHPFEDWTQKEFYEFAAFTTQVKLQVDPSPAEEKEGYKEMRKVLKDRSFDEWIVLREAARVKHAEIIGGGTGYLRLPHDYKYKDGKPHEVMQANALWGDRPKVDYMVKKEQIQKHKNVRHVGPSVGSKQVMANWMTSTNNEMFTKNFVNRLWYKVMGSELIGPLENLEFAAEGSHPELTEALCEVMKQSNYDPKAFLRTLMNTRAYQSHAHEATSEEYHFHAPIFRRMSAEEIWDSCLSLMMDAPDQSVLNHFRYDGFTYFYEEAEKMTPADVIKYAETSKLNRSKFYAVNDKKADKERNPEATPYYSTRSSEYRHPISKPHMLKLYGQSTREVINGGNLESSLTQALFLMNGQLEDLIILDKKNALNKHLAKKTVGQQIEAVYLAILGRQPSERERGRLANVKRKDIEDLIWALLNSNEFKFKA